MMTTRCNRAVAGVGKINIYKKIQLINIIKKKLYLIIKKILINVFEKLLLQRRVLID